MPLAAPTLGAEKFAVGYYVCFWLRSSITSQVVTAEWNFLSPFSQL
jgi:hypothetical protein